METHRGTDGVIIVEYQGWPSGQERQQIEVQSFTATETVAIIADNANGDSWDTHLVGRSNFSGTIVSNFDLTQQEYDDTEGGPNEGDPDLDRPTEQIGPAYLGATLSWELYPVGDDNADTDIIRIAGEGTVTSVETSNNHDNTVLTMTLQFTGTGSRTNTRVPQV